MFAVRVHRMILIRKNCNFRPAGRVFYFETAEMVSENLNANVSSASERARPFRCEFHIANGKGRTQMLMNELDNNHCGDLLIIRLHFTVLASGGEKCGTFCARHRMTYTAWLNATHFRSERACEYLFVRSSSPARTPLQRRALFAAANVRKEQ